MKCYYCGLELRETAKFCSYCGNAVNDNYTENTEANVNNSGNEKGNLIGCDFELVQENKSDSSQLKNNFEESNDFSALKEKNKPEKTKFVEKGKLSFLKKSIISICVVVAAVCAYIVPNYVFPRINYNNAVKLYKSEDFETAEAVFSKNLSYKDSEEYILKCQYGKAEKLLEDGLFLEAADAFSAINYSDSENRADECIIGMAEMYIENGDFDSAIDAYVSMGKTELAENTALKKIEALAEKGDYFEAAELAEIYCDESTALEYRYLGSLVAMQNGDYQTAANNFYSLSGYKDSVIQAQNCTYSFYYSEYAANGASENIVRGFYFLGNYRNSEEMFRKASYEYAKICIENGDYFTAASMFKNAGNYESAANELYMARYELGDSLSNTDPASARSVFALLSNYSDSARKKMEATAKLPANHESWYADGFTSTNGYYTTTFLKSDTLIVSCTAGTDSISAPITLTLTLCDSEGNIISADCENIRNSSSFSGSFSLSSLAAGNADIIISRKDNGTVLRTIKIKIDQ